MHKDNIKNGLYDDFHIIPSWAQPYGVVRQTPQTPNPKPTGSSSRINKRGTQRHLRAISDRNAEHFGTLPRQPARRLSRWCLSRLFNAHAHWLAQPPRRQKPETPEQPLTVHWQLGVGRTSGQWMLLENTMGNLAEILNSTT